mgnify:CR=1 FL=1
MAKRKAPKAPNVPATKKDALARLRSLEGHLRGVIDMVEADTYCVDVLQQTKAIRGALSKVEGMLLDRHLHHCVSTAIRSSDRMERERVIDELLLVYDANRRT